MAVDTMMKWKCTQCGFYQKETTYVETESGFVVLVCKKCLAKDKDK